MRLAGGAERRFPAETPWFLSSAMPVACHAEDKVVLDRLAKLDDIDDAADQVLSGLRKDSSRACMVK